LNLRIYNDSQSAINLAAVSVKYWYTFEGTGSETAELDYAGIQPGGVNITPNVLRNIQAISQGGQDRVEITTFNASAGSITAGGYVVLQMRIHKNDWSNYTQTNDYSFGTQAAYQDWTKITVYISGAKVWGTEPGAVGPAVVAKETETPDDAAFNAGNVYVFPNPASSGATIRFYSDGLEDITVLITDMNGKKVRAGAVDRAGLRRGINYTAWDLKNELEQDVANGVYLMEIRSGPKIVVKKIAVVR
jgi:hypothetical protein